MNGFKIICPMCYGMSKMLGYTDCDNCGNKGEVDPPQEILDDLECAEIEVLLFDLGIVEIRKIITKNLTEIKLFTKGYDEEFNFKGKTKLEALKKAADYIGKKK